jgi:hypothetical protein
MLGEPGRREGAGPRAGSAPRWRGGAELRPGADLVMDATGFELALRERRCA